MAGHVIEALFQKGYAVHAVLPVPLSAHADDSAEDDKVAHLWTLEQQYGPSTGAKLVIFYADALSEYPFYEAALGCQAFINSAAETTPAALRSAARANVNQVVLTLSVSTMSPTTAKVDQKDCKYDVHDVNDISAQTGDTQAIAHMHAEAAVEAWLKSQNISQQRERPSTSEGDNDDDVKVHVASVHFAEAWGPHQSKRATNVRQELLDAFSGELPFYYPMHYHTVDVRDVARAHVHIVESGHAQGRYIVSHGELSTVSMADVFYVVSLYPTLAHAFYMPIPLTLPVWIFSLIQPYHNSLSPEMVGAARRGLGCGYDGSRLEDELSFVYKYDSVVDTIQEYVTGLVEVGVIEDASLRAHRPQWHIYAAVLALLLPVVMTIISFSVHSLVICLFCRNGPRRRGRRGRGMDKSE